MNECLGWIMSGPKRGTGLASFKQETTHPIGSAVMGEVVPGEELYGGDSEHKADGRVTSG